MKTFNIEKMKEELARRKKAKPSINNEYVIPSDDGSDKYYTTVNPGDPDEFRVLIAKYNPRSVIFCRF
jgi:hypothetical protein